MSLLGHSEIKNAGEPGAESAEVKAPDSSTEQKRPSEQECQETKDVNETAEPSDGETQSESNNEKKPLTDDNGNEISDKGGNLKPNNTYKMFGVEYKTDDNGKEYSIDSEHKPNDTFVIDGHEYKTDDNGKVYCCDGVCISKKIENVEADQDGNNDKKAIENDNAEDNLEKVIKDYINDLKENSECPETIPDSPFDSSDLQKLSPEENAKMREEFDEKKTQLKKEWEEKNGRPWPKYDHDVYSANGKLIRKAGSDYDAHHIQPLGMGGKNEASNITPLNAEVHYDKQGVHSPNSPYSQMNKIIGGEE